MSGSGASTASSEAWEIADWRHLASEPVVSVVMLAYNHGPYLAEAVESVVRQQSALPFELIIGDDCSVDDTLKVALNYQRRRPDVIRVLGTSRNLGMHANHRRLIEASRGQYLAFCEGDDYWQTSDKLERQAKFLLSHPTYGAVHSSFHHINEVRGVWLAEPSARKRHDGSIPEGRIFHRLLKQNLLQTCTAMIRADLVEEYISSDLPIDSYAVGDWPMFLFISAKSDIGFIDEPLAVYRKVPGSMMNQGMAAEIRRIESYQHMVSDFCREFAVPAQVEHEAQVSLMTNLAYQAIHAGDHVRAARAVEWLAAESPEFLRGLRGTARLVASRHPLAAAAYNWAAGLKNRCGRRRRFTIPAPPFQIV